MNNPSFVKKFDFRGVYGKDIKDEDAFYLSLALFSVLKPKKILIGWDTRASSKTLALHFIQALKDKEVEISYLDKTPIDYVTAAAYACDFDLSIMFTGSHNTWEWSGLLIHTKGGISLQGDIVLEVIEKYNGSKNIKYSVSSIDLSLYTNFENTIEKLFTERIKSLLPLEKIKKLNVVVDLGDGSGSKSLSLLEKLLPQVKFDRLNDRNIYDASTPHTADPSEIKNISQVINTVIEKKYAAGFAFDSDADRVLAIDEKGEYINGSMIGGALVECFKLLGISIKNVGYAVECGPSLYNSVIDLNTLLHAGINIQPIPVGRSLVRSLIFNDTIDMGVENVGHFYIKDFFMTDSGVFVLAVLLYWMSMYGDISGIGKSHPDGLRGQDKVPNNHRTQSNDALAEDINSIFTNMEIKKIDVDGMRIEVFQKGHMNSWYAVRNSGYEPIEKIYYGSLNPEVYGYLKQKFLLLTA